MTYCRKWHRRNSSRITGGVQPGCLASTSNTADHRSLRSRVGVVVVGGAVEAGCIPEARPSRNSGALRVDSRRTSQGHQQSLHSQDEVRNGTGGCWSLASAGGMDQATAAAHGRCRPVVADRVYQSRQYAAGARGDAGARNGLAPLPRSRPLSLGPPGTHRVFAAFRSRQSARRLCGLLRRRSVSANHHRGTTAGTTSRVPCPDRHACVAFHRRNHFVDGIDIWTSSRPARHGDCPGILAAATGR